MTITFNLLAALFCMFASIFFGCQYWSHKMEVDRAGEWGRVTGVMEKVTISQYEGRRSTHIYTPHVLYKFAFAGKDYQGNVISFPDPSFTMSTEAKKFQAQYPEGGLISVYFNEKNPTKSCLEPGDNVPLMHEFCLCGGCLALSIIFAIIPERAFWDSGGMYRDQTRFLDRLK